MLSTKPDFENDENVIMKAQAALLIRVLWIT